jgi:hypothetical protein
LINNSGSCVSIRSHVASSKITATDRFSPACGCFGRLLLTGQNAPLRHISR